MTTLEFRDKLARRTRRAKAPIALNMLEPLESYYRLLAQWNARMNLTALPLDPLTDATFDRLLVEPLCAAKQIPTHTPAVWFDLGSGGGSPAIPLKIARPALRLTMIESKERKGVFLREAIRVLGLEDSQVETSRFEEIAGKGAFSGTADYITVRAVKLDGELFQLAGKMLKMGGKLLLFRPAHSPSSPPPGFELSTTAQLCDTPPSFICVFKRVPRGTSKPEH
jgi:16S rRNA (guanine527-N7)-methyltransferase